MRARRQFLDSLRQRLRGPYQALGQLDAHLYEIDKRLSELQPASRAALETRELMGNVHDVVTGEMRAIMRALVSEEAANRRRLEAMRAAPEYRAAWTEERP